jgi:hypothetical protein
VFATVVNAGTEVARDCAIAPETHLPATFAFQPTDPATNVPTGTSNAPVDIGPETPQTFVVAFTPGAPFPPTMVALRVTCANTVAAPVIPGVNSVLLVSSPVPVPDTVALAATSAGIVDIPGPDGTGLFAVATVNVGAAGTITVSGDTGDVSLPLTLSVCSTESSTGACTDEPAPAVTRVIASAEAASFAVFARAHGAIAFDPARHRVFVRFVDAFGMPTGATSVAIRVTGEAD